MKRVVLSLFLLLALALPADATALFWIGGTGNTSDTAHWSASSGGLTCSCTPVAADTIALDTNSGTGTVTVDTALSATSITHSKASLTLSASAAMTISGGVTVTAGTLVTGAFTHSFGSLVSTSGTRTLTFDNSTLNITGASAVVWNLVTTGALTFTATGSTINILGASARFIGAAKSYGTVVFSGGGQPTTSIAGSNTFVNLSFIGTASVSDLYTIGGTTQTVSGLFTATGNSVTNRLWVKSDTIGTNRTINAASVSLTNVDFSNITGAGVAAPFTGTSIGDFKGNSQITATLAKTAYWVGNGGSWSGAKWALSSGGAGSSANFPLPQDTIVFDANSITSTGQTIVQDTARYGTVDFTGVLNNPILSTTLFSTYYVGNLTFAAGMTSLGSVQHNWVHQSGTLTYTSNGVRIIGDIQLSANAGAVLALGDDVAINENLIINTGTMTWNNHNLTMGSALLSTNLQTRVLNFGTGTTTIGKSAAGLMLDFTLSTGLTINAGSSTIVLASSAPSSGVRTFAGGGMTFGTVIWSEPSAVGTLAITGANTFGTLQVNPGAAKTLRLPASTTQTISTLLLSGGTNYLAVNSATSGTPATLSVANAGFVGHNLSVKDITISGAGTPFYAVQSVDVSGNTGWTFGIPAGTPTSTLPSLGVGGWLIKRDLDPANDNSPMWLEKAA